MRGFLAGEFVERRAEFRVTSGKLRGRNSFDGRFPGLLQAAYAGGRAERMSQDASPGSEDQVGGS
jgi:hypothetical protein